MARTSTHRLSSCPACGRHVRLAADWRDTLCPFCEHPLAEPCATRTFPGRGGVLATSLLSVGLAGWDYPVKDAKSAALQQAFEPVDQPLYGVPSPIEPAYGIPSPMVRWVGSIEGGVGLAPSATLESDDALIDTDPGVLLSVIPSVDRMLGRWLSLGVEVGANWLGAPAGAKDASGADLALTLVFNPNLRVGLRFPLRCFSNGDVFLSTTVAGGPAIWLSNGSDLSDDPADSTRLGYGLRASVGGGYRFSGPFSVFAGVGYYLTQSFGDDATLTHSAFPVTAGLKWAFAVWPPYDF